jgi:autotransporter-associated beta strand protein
MSTAWTLPRLNDQFRARRRCVARRRAPVFRPRLEALENRVVPATATWDGGGATSNWSNPGNWVGDVLPAAGDDLVFPAGAARLTNFNNFPNTSFNSLTFSGSGYVISGGPLNVLNLGAGGIVDSDTTGTNSYGGPIQLGATRTIDVADGGTLVLGGALSGSGGLTKTGAGALTLNGASANTFTGVTSVRGGALLLDKGGDTGPALAIASSNLIVTSGDASSRILLLRSDQVADNATLTISGGLSFFGFSSPSGGDVSDTIGPLTMTGGMVRGGAGQNGSLTLNGNVSASPASGNSPTPATISGLIRLDSGARTFTVNAATGSPDVAGLVVDGLISGAGLIKEGTGVMELRGGRRANFDQAEVNAGTLLVNGKLVSPSVIVRNVATLSGTGNVAGFITTDRVVSTLDDGGPGFTAPGWLPVTGQGLGNDLSVAAPSAATGSVVTASWTFTGLPPGAYRVFATWTGGSNRTTGAPFSVFDNATLRRTLSINQERAPVGGPRIGGFLSQPLGGPVNISSGTLRVGLSNAVPMEADGAGVIADAVRIEGPAGTFHPGGAGDRIMDVAVEFDDGGVTLGPGSTYRVDFVNTGPGSDVADLLGTRRFTTSEAVLVLSASSFSPPSPGTAFRIIDTGPAGSVAFANLPNNNDTIELVAGDGGRHTFTINYTAGDGNDVALVYQNTATQVRDLTLSPGIINEGDRVTLRGALTDPNRGDVLSLRIDWGDGAVQTFRDLGTRPFQFAHAYADNSPAGSPYRVRVSWSDQHGAGNFRSLPVTVNNVLPRLFLGGAEVLRAGGVLRHAGFFTDPGADRWRATANYGDGSGVRPLAIRPATFRRPLANQPGQHLLFEHRYTRPGTYRVTVTVFDDDGGLGTETFLVIVLPAL